MRNYNPITKMLTVDARTVDVNPVKLSTYKSGRLNKQFGDVKVEFTNREGKIATVGEAIVGRASIDPTIIRTSLSLTDTARLRNDLKDAGNYMRGLHYAKLIEG